MHRSAHSFIIEINSRSHRKRKQPQIIFLQFSCSVTMINIVKKCLWKKIYELNTLIGCSDDFESQAQYNYIVKNRLLQSNYWWLLPLFCYVLHPKLRFLQKLALHRYTFFYLKSFLRKCSLTVKVRKKIIDQVLGYISFCF